MSEVRALQIPLAPIARRITAHPEVEIGRSPLETNGPEDLLNRPYAPARPLVEIRGEV